MVRHSTVWLLLAAALLLAACEGGRHEPRFSDVALPSVAADRARIFFYRDYEISESLAEPWISLNGKEAALSVPGGVSYRDVPPGRYYITVLSPGLYTNQFKAVRLRAGETLYVKIESLASWDAGKRWQHDTFVVAPIDPTQARAEIAEMRYVSGLP